MERAYASKREPRTGSTVRHWSPLDATGRHLELDLPGTLGDLGFQVATRGDQWRPVATSGRRIRIYARTEDRFNWSPLVAT